MTRRPLTVQQCAGCGRVLFPRRAACSVCGSGTLADDIAAGPGEVLEVVELYLSPGRRASSRDEASSGEGGDTFVLVSLDAGPRVIAKTAVVLARGDQVFLFDERGAITAQAGTQTV